MNAVNLNELNLAEVMSADDPSLRIRVDFPFYAAKGTASSAVVYFELEPGARTGRHTDSAEEIVLVLQGEAEAVVDGERGRLAPGGMALIPAMSPHDVVNVGNETLRVVGFFANSTVIHTFSEPLIPGAETAVFVHGRGPQEVFAATPLTAPVAS